MAFEDAQHKMIQYLNSTEFKNREDATTTVPSIPILVSINQAGLITQGSQEGISSKGYNAGSGMYYEERERAHVMGAMKTAEGRRFVDWINMHTDKVAFEVAARDDPPGMRNADRPSIVVTIIRTCEQEADLTNTPFHDHSQILTVLSPSDLAQWTTEMYLDKNADVVHINVFDPKYGRRADGLEGLYQDVLKGLKMNPV